MRNYLLQVYISLCWLSVSVIGTIHFHDRFMGPSTYTVLRPLVLEACRGDTAAVKRLIYTQRNVNARDKSRGQTALLEAAKRGFEDIVELLIKHGADVNLADQYGVSPVERASTPRILKMLLQAGGTVGPDRNPVNLVPLLVFAAGEGFVEIVSFAIENGVDVNMSGRSGDTALYRAAQAGHVECMKLLVARGADLNHQIQGVFNPMIAAAAAGHLEAVRLLVNHGAQHSTNADTISADGHRSIRPLSAIIEAAINLKGEVVRLLVESGAVSGNVEFDLRRILNSKEHDTQGRRKTHDIIRMLLLGGIHPACFNDVWLRIYSQSITDPLDSIELAVDHAIVNENSVEVYYQMVDNSLLAKGLSSIQGILSYAFSMYKRGKRVLTVGSEMHQHFFDKFGLDNDVIHVLDTLLYRLSVIGCSLMNFTFTVAPYIEIENLATLRRLLLGLGLFTPDNGYILNQMIQRSSTVGFRPVLKALYAVYLDLMYKLRILGYPEDLSLEISSFIDLNDRAMAQLKIALDKHYQAYGKHSLSITSS